MTSRPGPDDLLPAAEVAEWFGCSVAEVSPLMRARGVVVVLRGRSRFYRRADVLRVWAAEFGHTPQD
jgi:hypothetical protein